MRPLDAAALAKAGKSAAEIAASCGVHIRTAYKLIARHKPPAAPREVPPDFDRAKALAAAVDRAVIAVAENDGLAVVDRLSKLARAAARLHALAILERQAVQTESREDVRERLAARVEATLRALPVTHEASAAGEQARREAHAPRNPPPEETQAPKPPPKPPFPWTAKLARKSDWWGDATVKATNEPPTPTTLITKPLNR